MASRKRNNDAPTNLRLIGGARVSFSREEQTSTASQLESVRDWCVRHGHILDDRLTYVEDGVSGFNRKAPRPDLERALRAIERGEANGLIVWKLDRLVRDLTHFMEIWNRINAAGGYFISVTEQFDTSTPMGRLMMVIVAAFAEMESDMKRTRMLRWNDHRMNGDDARANGALPPCGPTPFGYTREEANTLTVNPTEAAMVVRMASALLEDGNLSEVVRMLDAEGFSRTRRGIKQMFKSPTVIGMREDEDGTLVPGNWKAIIDEATWRAVGERINGTDRVRHTKGNGMRHFLVGLVTCATCDVPVITRGHRDGPRYVCKSCGSSLGVDVVDGFVTDTLLASIDRQAWKSLREQGTGFNATTVDAIATERETLNAMKQAGEISIAEYRAQIQANNARLEAAQTAPVLDLPDVDDLASAWDALTITDRRMVVEALVASIRLLPWQGMPKYDKRSRIQMELAS